ncbi:hypothetical protein [Phyllobacterium zundukense]|uniref:Anti-sigma factor NepR domain-containing protein n=1 Tax=Phyllobacterium zundukense TaxID=1867719 RepID=A0A2N9W574_9HYPH|nr:hypothetical protein [Phyllobacterium zundukense]ATU94272.1 hypothetical protein BLM14_21165 [Phyllobacterium zundukense]PIO46892.1 hypothetical protein B5P45_00125 [Phyllobacterium zundukense]
MSKGQDMGDGNEEPKRAKINWQPKRPEYREALRSGFRLLPSDKIFEQLLKRLDEAERDQTKY